MKLIIGTKQFGKRHSQYIYSIEQNTFNDKDLEELNKKADYNWTYHAIWFEPIDKKCGCNGALTLVDNFIYCESKRSGNLKHVMEFFGLPNKTSRIDFVLKLLSFYTYDRLDRYCLEIYYNNTYERWTNC